MLRILRLLNRFRPREGWVILILAWVAVCSLPAAAIEGRIIAGLNPAIWLATLAVLATWALAYWTRLRGWLAAPVLLLTGVVADLTWGVYVLDVRPLVLQAAAWLNWGTRCGLNPECLLPAPPITYFVEQWAGLARFGQRVAWWASGAAAGQGVADNLVLVGLAGLIAWLVATWAGWWVARNGQPFVATLPTGALLAMQVYAADAGYGWLLTYLAAAVLLLVLVRYHRLTRSWEATGADYSPEVWLEVYGIGVALVSLVLILAPLVPVLTPKQISEAFWRRFREPYQQVEERLGQSFPGVEGRRSLIPATGVAGGGLPRAHLLGGRPELGQEIALRVWPRGAREGDLLYWRGQTFGRYTGRGWEDDAAGKGAFVAQEFPAGAAWSDLSATASRHPVLSAVEVVQASRAVLYAAGEPVSADRPYTALQRAPGELIALSAADRAARYNVLGQVASQDATLLRTAGVIYPTQVVSLYLTLPPNLPPQLIEYAVDVTRGARAPYDAAVAIETALRTLEYTLNVPAPPADRELTSWFLFDLRKGYCDYFATAMAVLARLAGIPSRLAIGYATGTLDEGAGGYVVTELQAHSWPELYFPGYGWIPFEPTPSQPLGERLESAQAGRPFPGEGYGPQDLAAGLAELRGLATVQAAATARITWAGRLLGVMCGLLLCWVVARLGGWWLLRRIVPAGGWAGEWYARLAAWGGRLGRPLRPADTPAEYAAAVAGVADALAGRARWRRKQLAAAAAVVRVEAPAVAQALENALFAPQPDSPPTVSLPSTVAARTGQRLWIALRWLWLMKRRT